MMTRLGFADLAILDTLITAGMANNRAEAIRWALSRIREHPAYPSSSSQSTRPTNARPSSNQAFG